MFENFQQAVKVKRFNRWMQIALALLLAFSMNRLCLHHFVRRDFTEGAYHSLSAETLAHLRGLKQPVRILMTQPSDSSSPASEQMQAVFKQASRLIRELAYAQPDKVDRVLTVELIDIYKQRDKVEELVVQYGVDPNSRQAMVVVGPFGYRQVHLDELYRQLPDGRVVFTGEEAFIAAILKVSTERQSKIYFTEGHGEINPNDTGAVNGLSAFRIFLKQRGYAVDTLDLTKTEGIPEDASLLMVVGPKLGFLGIEQEKLRRWTNDEQGRVWFLLEPSYPHGMDDLFYEWGFLVDDRLIVETSEQNITGSGQLLIGNFGEHSITRLLRDQHLKVIVGQSRPVRPHLGAAVDAGLRTQIILQSSSTSWAEKYYRTLPIQFEKIVDIPGPVGMAMVAEKISGLELGLNLKGGKIAVFGNVSLLSNQNFHSGANALLVNETLNWILERENLLNIPVKPHHTWQLILEKRQIQRILLYLMLPSVIVGLLGFIVYMFRRR